MKKYREDLNRHIKSAYKAQEWGGMCQRYKNINLNKIQRSDERVSQGKQSLERHNDSLQNKRSASSLHCSREVWAVSM